jgi:hypothetical protein
MARKISAQSMADTVQSAATGAALGELFQYNVSTPVTVGRGQSAMVPIVSSTLGFKKDLIYNGRKMSTHPVATMRFNNSTGLTLERGPVTVFENGEYMGEAVLPFTADQAEAVISYAVELGVHIKEESKTETHLHALRLKDGYLLQDMYDIRQIIYTVDNRTPQSKGVLLEHPLNNNHYTIFETPEPAEKTLDTHRYKVEVSPRQMATFTVKERMLRTRQEALQNLSYRGIQQYFEDKLLDKTAYQGIKALLDVWAEIERLQQNIAEQEQRRAKIYETQQQAQQNMQVLSASGEEGKLRGRYVQQLSQSEEELATIAHNIQQTQAIIERKRAEVDRMIAALG